MMYKTNDKSRHIFHFQSAYRKLRICNHRLHPLFGKVHAMQTQTPLEIRRSSLQCTLSPKSSLLALSLIDTTSDTNFLAVDIAENKIYTGVFRP